MYANLYRLGHCLFAILTILICINACQSSKHSVNAELPVSAGYSTVTAEIISISEERLNNYPCSEVACVAKVKITKINRRSGSFTRPLAAGQESEMRFTFTLSKTTNKLFPNLEKQFPGLKKGDRFKVNIAEELLLESNTTRWIAYDYILLN